MTPAKGCPDCDSRQILTTVAGLVVIEVQHDPTCPFLNEVTC